MFMTGMFCIFLILIACVHGSSEPWRLDVCEYKYFERNSVLDGYLYNSFKIGTRDEKNDLSCILDCFYHDTCMSVVYRSPDCHMYFAQMDTSSSKEAEVGATYIQLQVDDHCATSAQTCHVNALLINGRMGCSCACVHGYDGDGSNCDVNECIFETDNCDINADCTNIIDSFECACSPGFQGNGTSCSDIDECSTNEHKCDVNADCANTPGSYNCTCHAMYEGDGLECKLKNIRGEACSIASDCIKSNFTCSGGVCDCELGNSYDIVNNECVERCDNYGTQFSHQSTTYCLSGYNDARFGYTSVDDCAKRCAEAVEFTCRTFEIWSGYCWLSESIKSDDLDAWDPWSGCRYYQRHCAVPS